MQLPPGTLAVVRYGRKGEQLAQVRFHDGAFYAVGWKWRHNGRRWTDTAVRLVLLRAATEVDCHRWRDALPHAPLALPTEATDHA